VYSSESLPTFRKGHLYQGTSTLKNEAACLIPLYRDSLHYTSTTVGNKTTMWSCTSAEPFCPEDGEISSEVLCGQNLESVNPDVNSASNRNEYQKQKHNVYGE
jgi:hypothetical protein